LVEHILGKDEVIGSIPIASSKIRSVEHPARSGKVIGAIPIVGSRVNKRKELYIERYYHVGMHKLQASELYNDEEQEETVRTRRVQEVLPVVQQTHTAQGDKIVLDYVSSSIGRAAVSKTAGWGFESLLTCTEGII
jgi:hypothetical protein